MAMSLQMIKDKHKNIIQQNHSIWFSFTSNENLWISADVYSLYVCPCGCNPSSPSLQVIQLYETMIVRHGVMLVGPTGGGKTTVYTILSDTLDTLWQAGHGKHNPFYLPVKTYVLNPKSVTMGELYGEVRLADNSSVH